VNELLTSVKVPGKWAQFRCR